MFLRCSITSEQCSVFSEQCLVGSVQYSVVVQHLKKQNMNYPTYDLLRGSEKTQIEIRDLIDSQLKTAEIQSKTSDKQYKVSIFLTVAAIIISLVPITTELFVDKPNYNESIIRLTESQSKLTEKVSDMSTYLLDLQNQVQILEKENARLNKELNK